MPDGKKLSQHALGQALNMSREKIGKIESGKQPLSDPADIIAFADFYGVSCDYILRGHTSENVRIVKELGLSNEAIEAIRELNKNRRKSRGILSDVFHIEHGSARYVLDHLDSAIELSIQQEVIQNRFDEEDCLEEPTIWMPNTLKIEYKDVIYAHLKMAGDAFIQNMYEFVTEEGRKYAKEIHP